MQHGKCQCKLLEKGWYNVIQKVKTLPTQKDKNAALVFSISIEHLRKAGKDT